MAHMIYEKDQYLEVKTSYDDHSIEISLNGGVYRLEYPKKVWAPLEDAIKRSIVDHIAFASTNYLTLIMGKKGVIYDTRLPLFDPSIFKNTICDLPSSAVLDKEYTADYIRDYFNMDFVFSREETIVWSRPYKPTDTAIISFTSGKESLLTLAVCLELGLKPILVNIIEPSNIYEHKHRLKLLKGLHEEFGVEYYTLPYEIGSLKDSKIGGVKNSSLGWGNQLFTYLFIFLPFVLQRKARYVFFGNEFSGDSETVNGEGFRTNFCYDQSSYWTLQLDNILRSLTGGAGRVGSLVGPLNEIAVAKCLHDGFPDLAKYQLSCFCDVPEAEEHRWCCSCSKCARNHAFLNALGKNPGDFGFWRDMFAEEYKPLFSVFGEGETFGYDRSGLGRVEQELALYMSAERLPENEFLRSYMKISRYNGGSDQNKELFKRDYSYYFGLQDYPAMPRELRQRVYSIYERILYSDIRET